MNICQFCGEPATIQLTDIINKVKKVSHLCDRCAREKQLIPEGKPSQLNLNVLVDFIVGTHSPKESHEPASPSHCPACGMRYSQFRAEGRLGCPHDYDVYRQELLPLLERVHRAERHAGKIPRRVAESQELSTLRGDLALAVAEERYEDAARLRDLIRQKELTDES
jgi:protein arginine kinase activator